MKQQQIRNTVARCLNQAGDFVQNISLIRRTAVPNAPGQADNITEISYSVRYMSLKPKSVRGGLEQGSPIDKTVTVGVIAVNDITPKPSDLLTLASGQEMIEQVISLDNGAGVLYEVLSR
jgi:hypothetical protein